MLSIMSCLLCVLIQGQLEFTHIYVCTICLLLATGIAQRKDIELRFLVCNINTECVAIVRHVRHIDRKLKHLGHASAGKHCKSSHLVS